MSVWICQPTTGKAAEEIVPPRSRIPWWKGLCADSGEKHAPASDPDAAKVDSLKALDPNRPIREADISRLPSYVRFRALGKHGTTLARNWPISRNETSRR